MALGILEIYCIFEPTNLHSSFKMKISILIPVNDFDIVALVHSMKDGMEKVPEFCEIIIGDDGSSPEFKKKYQSLASGIRSGWLLRKKTLEEHRSETVLIPEATGDFLLFIDADAMVRGTAESYLHKWLEYLDHARVISGGIFYQ